MARAKVKLQNCESFSTPRGGGKPWRKGDQRIVTNENDIVYFKSCPEFTVTILHTPKPKSPPPEAVAEEEEEEVSAEYTAADLKKQSKGSLQEIGAEFDLDLDPAEHKKGEMIEHILEAQAKAKDESED